MPMQEKHQAVALERKGEEGLLGLKLPQAAAKWGSPCLEPTRPGVS